MYYIINILNDCTGGKMSETVLFLFNSALLGIGLAMDALSVSLANGMNEPTMKRGKCSSSQECLADFRG